MNIAKWDEIQKRDDRTKALDWPSEAGSSPANPKTQDRLLNAREVAARLGVSERFVRDHATRRQPRLRAVKLGSLVRFRLEDVQDFIQARLAENDCISQRNRASRSPFSVTELRGQTGER
jgi:excisionase family DNA binding protein